MCQVAHAETFYLKNGKKLVGTSKELDSNTLEIIFGKKGVRRYEKVKKSDIRKITREDVELELFGELEALMTTPDLMTAEWYSEQTSKLQNFKTEFPTSDLFSKVTSIERALQKEQAMIKKGGVKVNGLLISAKEKVAREYDINAGIEARKFQQYSEAKKRNLAINAIDKLEKDYAHSKAFSDLYPKLPEFLNSYHKSLNLKKQILKESHETHAKALKALKSSELIKYTKYRKQKEEAFNQQAKKDNSKGLRWQKVNPYKIRSVDDLQRQLASYKTEVESKLGTLEPQNAGESFTKAWNFVSNAEFSSANPLIEQLADLNFNASYLLRLEEYYEEERDRHRESQRREKRGHELVPEDLYANVDTRILDTLTEVIGVIQHLEKPEEVKKSQLEIFVKAARIERLMSYRGNLELSDKETLGKINKALQEKRSILLQKLDAVSSNDKGKESKQRVQPEIEAFKAALLK